MTGPGCRPVDIDPRRPLRSTLGLLMRYRARVLVALLFFAIKDCPQWLLPVITASIIDVVVARGPVSTIGWLTIGAAALLIQNYPSATVFIRLYMSAVRSVAADLRNALTARLQVLSIGFHARSSASVIQSKVVRDVENVELMFSQGGNPALTVVSVFAGAVTMTAITVPQFLPVFALSVPTGVAIWWTIRSRSMRRNEEFRREMEHFSARVGEMATLMPITRAHGLESVARDRVSEVAEGVRSRGLRLDVLNGSFAAISWVSMQLLTVLCLSLAAVAAVTGWADITPGQVVLLSTYFTFLTGAVNNALNLYPLVARGGESARSIAEVLSDPDLEHNEGKREVKTVRGRIEVEGLRVVYGDAATPALDGVDLVIEPGETIAFVGQSGSGKSTLMNTVLGFIRPTGGRILLDGEDMQELDLRTMRRHVSVVPQESVLFEGSIRDNVTYGLGQIDDATVARAMRSANAMQIVERLPNGWDTLVGERGARLSGGQRQRLSIARALIRDPRILLLDEATSALDSESEALIQDAMAVLLDGRTTLVIAHRLSTVRDADRIVVLEDGRVIEVGTHDELVAVGGRYTRLWELQHGPVG